MHYAKIEKSERLQRVLNLLRQGGSFTTREIIMQADVCAVNSIIAELKANNYNIQCTCLGRGIFQYKLL